MISMIGLITWIGESAALSQISAPIGVDAALGAIAQAPSLEAMLKGADLGVMAAIGTITFFLDRAKMISDRVTIVTPLVLGGIWGCVEALGAASSNDPLATIMVIQHAMRGMFVNGATACVIGMATQRALSAAMKRKT